MLNGNEFKSGKSRRGVFISYARSDGEAFAAELRRKLEPVLQTAEIPLWHDRVALEGGRDWWLQITEALDHVAFMALIVTPNALKSDIVRKEWRYARQQGVCVYPIKASPDLDFASMPRWMRDAHFYDLDHEWDKFVAHLKQPCETPRVPFMSEDLPEDFVPRPGEFDQLITLLLDQQREEPIAITAALRGAGGYGKTTLAKALCHDERIQEAFDDGILWVTLGENPGNLVTRVEELIHTLSGDRPGFTSITAAITRLKELLADRDLLIVIDDVWNRGHLEPFLQGGPRCARLITTRNLDILPSNAQQVKVDAMQPGEAMLLLGAKLAQRSEQTPQQSDDDEIDRELRALSERLGHWPLLLDLANSTLRDRVAAGETLSAALAFHNADLTENGLTEFAVTDDAARESVVKKVLSVSFKRLTEAEEARFYELAIFPEKANVPLATVEKLWKQTGNLTRTNADKLSTRLFNLSLLLNLDRQSKTLRLHDVIRKFLNDEQKGQLAPTHNQLLDAHRPATRWADLTEDEPYLWDHLAFHLIGAGRGDELVTTVKDWRYLTKKTFLRKSQAVEKDLVQAAKHAPDDDPLQTLWRNYVNTSHILNHCQTHREITATLFVRLQHLEDLKAILQDMAQRLERPHIALQSTLPDLPHPALVRTLEGHSADVTSCAFSPDGKLIVSISKDVTLKVWDAITGELRRSLEGHSSVVTSCAFSPDGKLIVSASWDKTLKVWGAQSGEMLRTLEGHSYRVNSCVFSPDGKLIVSASDDSTLKVWDTITGELLRTLGGNSYSVRSCAFSPDGKLIVSGSENGLLKVWNAITGESCHTLEGHSYWVNSCVFSPDGKLIVSASSDSTLKVWDAITGELLRTLEGHLQSVRSCAFSLDGKLIVSASEDNTLKIWDAMTGKPRRSLEWHSAGVTSCALRSDGKLIVSASEDNTLKIWDAMTGELLRTLDGHLYSVRSCAFSLDGKLIVSASADRTLKVWDAITGKLRRTLEGHSYGVNDCAFSLDGKLIVSASSDRTLKVWDAMTGELLRTLEGSSADVGYSADVTSCAFSPDGNLIVSTPWDKWLIVWGAQSGEMLRTLEVTPHSVNDFAFSPDGKLIVVASNDSTLKVWNATTGERGHTFDGHSKGVSCCAFSPDGKLIISTSYDSTLKVWDAMTGQCLATFFADGPLSCCAIYGEMIVAGGARGVYFLRLVR